MLPPIDHPQSGITGILLAAGQARRFGGGKLLHRLDSGAPIGIAAYRNLRAALDQVLVVVRPDDVALANLFADAGAQVVWCADAQLGLSRSLISGVDAAPAAHGLIIALADMPFVQPATIQKLVEILRDGALLAAPIYAGKRGNPVAFSAQLRTELSRAIGDAGAREVINRHAHEMTQIHCDDPGVLRDIDTREDLRS